MSDGYFNELDGELEEDRVSLEKLGKRVTVLETDTQPTNHLVSSSPHPEPY